MSDNRFWGEDWPRIRGAWALDPAVAHLNHGSYGATPVPVLEAQSRWRGLAESNPNAFFGRLWLEALAEARRRTAQFLGADPAGFVFVPNATVAVNTVIAGLELGPGDEVLVLDHGYGACRMAAERWAARVGAVVTSAAVPMPAGTAEEAALAVLGAVVGATGPRTRLAILDHITSPTALLMPIERLIRQLRGVGVPVLVDCAHAPGMLDVDLAALGADFWTGNLHKWACAPKGAAGLWVSADRRERIAPLVTSWFSDDGFVESFSWSGTDDRTAWLAVPDALAFMGGLGWHRVRRHNAELAAYGASVVRRAVGTEPPVRDDTGCVAPSMRLVELPGGLVQTADAARELTARIARDVGCEVAVTLWNGRGFIRLSTQVYNRPADYERLAEGLPAVL